MIRDLHVFSSRQNCAVVVVGDVFGVVAEDIPAVVTDPVTPDLSVEDDIPTIQSGKGGSTKIDCMAF